MRLLGTPWTLEFMQAYERALAGSPLVHVHGTQQGTWRWLCEQYFASPHFRNDISETFQGTRRRILEATFDEPIKPGSPLIFGDCPLRDFKGQAVRVLRDRKADKIEGANNRLKAIKAVFKWATSELSETVRANPARDVAKFRRKTDGYHTWTVDEVEQFCERHQPGTMARRAAAVLLYTGVRRSDAVRLGRQMVTRDGTLRFQIRKRKRTDAPQWHEIPVLPGLAAELAPGPQDNLTWLTTSFGKPFTDKGFGNWFKDRCREAGLPHCTAHGLRKAGATFAAENGASDAQLMAMYGWKTVKQAAEYRRNADQKRLAQAAMKLIAY